MRMEYFRRPAATEEIAFMDRREVLSFRIGDVRDYASVLYQLRDADVVFNASAMKQVPICEYAPFEGVLTKSGRVIISCAPSVRITCPLN